MNLRNLKEIFITLENNGGKIILKRKQLLIIVILTFITILSLNFVSANQINDTTTNTNNNMENNNIGLRDTINEDNTKTETTNSTKDIKTNKNENPIQSKSPSPTEDIKTNKNENQISSNFTSENKLLHTNDKTVTEAAKNTTIHIEVNSTYVGDELVIYLKDTNNAPLVNEKLSILINNNNYDKITDINGAVNLKLDLPANNYPVTVNYLGNKTYNPTSKKFDLLINKKQSNIIIPSYSVVKGRNLIIQLLDNQGLPIKQKMVSISIFNTNFNLQTDDNGLAYLKINQNTGNYNVYIRYDGDTTYSSSENTFSLNVYQLKTNFIVSSKWVVRGTNFITYLKDTNGNPVVGVKVKLTFKKKKYTKVTDSNGRISLKINNKIGKYKVKLIYNGDVSHIKTSRNLVIRVYRTKTKITAKSFTILKGNPLIIYLKDKSNRPVQHRALTITWHEKKYKRVTDGEGKVLFNLPNLGSYSFKIRFAGTKGYIKSSRTLKVSMIDNYDFIDQKAIKVYLNGNEQLRYNMRILDSTGNPVVGENIHIKTKCNNFTSGTCHRITKKTIVLDSDKIYNKAKDKRLLKKMAKLLRAKGYKVIISGIGPNYHVKDVKKYSNVCVFSLVGGIDSGMFVDMASSYYKKLLRKHNNQFVLGCVRSPRGINLADRIWLNRAHDDDYSDASFHGLTFPGQYLNKKANIDYVYGPSASLLVNNFLNYARQGKSIGMHNTIPGTYKQYDYISDENGYVSFDLPLGTHTIIASYFDKFQNSWLDATEYVKVMT